MQEPIYRREKIADYFVWGENLQTEDIFHRKNKTNYKYYLAQNKWANSVHNISPDLVCIHNITTVESNPENGGRINMPSAKPESIPN